MSLLRNITSGLRSLFRKDQVDRELNEELGAYLEMEAAEKMKQGMNRKDALRAVRLERGSLDASKEVVRSAGQLFVAERDQWIDTRRPSCRNPARDGRRHRQQHRGSRQRRQIIGRDANEL